VCSETESNNDFPSARLSAVLDFGGVRVAADTRSRELAAGALFQVQAIGRPEQPGAQLCHAIEALWIVPVSIFPGTRPVGPLAEIRRHPAMMNLG